MRLIGYLTRRGGRFHFRRSIPVALRSRLDRVELVRSLGTPDARIARTRASELYLLSEAIFQAARDDNSMLTTTQLTGLVQAFYDHVLDRENELRLGVRASRFMPQPLPDDLRQRRAEYFSELAESSRQALASNRLADAAMISEALLRSNGLSALSATERAEVQQAMLRAGIDLAEALASRYQGDFNYEPKDRLLKARLTEFDNQPQHPRPAAHPSDEHEEPPALDGPAPPPSRRGPSLSELHLAFRDMQLTTNAWDKQTAAQAGSSYRLFIQISGDKPLTEYTRQDAGRFRDLASRLPSDYGKAALYKGQPVEQILKIHAAQSPKHRTPTISQRTVKRHFSALSMLWTSAIARGEVSHNIFSGFRFGNAKRPIDQRAMWEVKDLEQLFATPVWAGCLSAARRSTPGKLIFRDERFWLPLIAVYSGMRQEEICQLHVEDIREEEGIVFFDLNNRPPRKLKNANAIRRVPIHSELIRLGLLDYVATMPKSRGGRLFPNLAPGGADDRLGHAFTKWFTRYRRDVRLYRPGLDFHSFRHSATTWLHQAGVQDSVIDRLTGHATPGETARYTKSTSLQQLKEAMERLSVGVDLTRLHVSQKPAA